MSDKLFKFFLIFTASFVFLPSFAHSKPVVLALYSDNSDTPLASRETKAFETLLSKQEGLFKSWSDGPVVFRPVVIDSLEGIKGSILENVQEGEELHAVIFMGRGIDNKDLMFDKENSLLGADLADLVVVPEVRALFESGHFKAYFAACSCGFSTEQNEGFQDAFMKRAVELNKKLALPFESILSLAHPYLISRFTYTKGIGALSVAIHTTGIYKLYQKFVLYMQSFAGNPVTNFLFSMFTDPFRTTLSLTFATTLVLLFPEVFGPFYIVYTAANQAFFKAIEVLQIGTSRLVQSGDENLETSYMRIREGLWNLIPNAAVSANSCRMILGR